MGVESDLAAQKGRERGPDGVMGLLNAESAEGAKKSIG